MRRRSLAALLALVAVAAVVLQLAFLRSDVPGPAGPGAVAVETAEADWSYVIPAGTGTRLDLGERVAILPARIEARVGETFRLVNEDSRGYLLGPFYVGARETVTQRFTSAGTFQGECAVHPSGRITLTVRD